MSDRDQDQAVTQSIVTNGEPDASPAVDTPRAQGSDGVKGFVPFFNEEYEFKLGSLGDIGIAYRLGAIFVLMLIGAVMMYLCAWWWVGTHPLAQHH